MRRADATPERILIVSLDNLGDLVFTSALTGPLRAAFARATIDIWCREYTADVARLVPHVSHVVTADPLWARQPHIPPVSLRRLLTGIRAVRSARYDVAIVTGAPWRTAAAVALTGAPVRIGAARTHNRHFLTDVVAPEDAFKPVVQEQARLLLPLGITPQTPRYELDAARLAPDAVAAVDDLPPRFVALHPFASQRDRCVPLVEWVRVAFELHAHDVPVVWIGMSHELEELRRSFTHPVARYVDRIGDGSLHTTAAVLSRASLFVGHDSGPLHVAAAFGVPSVGVFAPGQPERTFPQGPGAWRMIHHPDASGIGARSMLYEIEELGLFSTT
jgi:ADP-heptose:LPS heptosyltransferase